MIDRGFAERFAYDWIEAWNRHDLDSILARCSDDFEFSSPKIPGIVNEPSGVLKGKANVGAYWAKGLSLLPDLRFELLTVFVGIDSMVIHYRNERGLVCAETMEFGSDMLVHRSTANHALQQ